jgi:hypothetical protein
VGRHTVLGTTIDDSMGEAFDKVARLLGITAVPGAAARAGRARLSVVWRITWVLSHQGIGRSSSSSTGLT